MFQDMFSTPGSPLPRRESDEHVRNGSRLWCRHPVGESGLMRRPGTLAHLTDAPEQGSDGDGVAQAKYETVAQLYADQSARLARILQRKTGDHDLAHDIAHDSFVRLLGMAPASLRAITSPAAFLRRTSFNLLVDRTRSRLAEERSLHDVEFTQTAVFDQLTVLETRETLRRLELALQALKPKTRAIFVAHRVEGLSYAEMSARFEISVKGIEKQMAKAIAKIDRLLDRD